jgi:hypothetical protein
LNAADLSEAMKLGGVLLEQLRWASPTGLQTPRQGILGADGDGEFRVVKCLLTKIHRLSFKVDFEHAHTGAESGKPLAAF